MKNNKFWKCFVGIVLTFITVLSFSSETFAMSITQAQIKRIRDDFEQTNSFEMAVSDLCLSVGDFVMEYLTFLMKEEVTVQKIIYNKVDALNANFFTNTQVAKKTDAPASEIVIEVVNEWYSTLKKIVIMIYLAALVAVGIKTLLGTPGKKAEAQELLIKWSMGIAILMFFPYLMRYSFDLNEGIILTMQGLFGGASGTYVGDVSDLRSKEYELRSPEYIKRGTYLLTLGSEDATNAYVENYVEYQDKGDIMRIVRALAGITGRMIYVIIWYIMLWQLIIFIYIYYKRFLMIAFLIAIFPITVLEYIIGTVSTGKQSAISSWSKEFFTNVFLQSIHAVIYAIISSVVMSQITGGLQTSGGITKLNYFLMIIAVNFVFVGEKMLRDIISAVTTSVENPEGELGQAYKSARAFGGKAKKLFGGK